ncbi:MAG TPA: universal stress protein [Solirubrobacteraceae bacterium]|nr:universal stress protein [Solirubrobacteraceae bacterium]
MSESIVVGTDGSSSAMLAVNEAARVARALGAELHLVSAFRPLRGAHVSGDTAHEFQTLPDSKVEATLSQAAAVVSSHGVPVSTHAVEREPVDALLGVADEVSANLIVVGSKGMHGARRLTLGNVPNQVSHRARCSVLIVATDRPDGSAAAGS